MPADRVIVTAPALDDDFGFSQRVEDLAIGQLVPQARIEAFDIAVFPGAAGLDVSGLSAGSSDPVLHRLGNELRAIARVDGGPDACAASLRRQAVRAGLQISKMKLSNQHFGEACALSNRGLQDGGTVSRPMETLGFLALMSHRPGSGQLTKSQLNRSACGQANEFFFSKKFNSGTGQAGGPRHVHLAPARPIPVENDHRGINGPSAQIGNEKFPHSCNDPAWTGPGLRARIVSWKYLR